MNLLIIQARMGSTRLPGKSLMKINAIPIIDWVLERVSFAKNINHIIFAIPDIPTDDVLYDHLINKQANIYRGSENDVLLRFYEAAIDCSPSNVIRVCADNPFIDPSSIDYLVSYFQDRDINYAYNHIPRNNRYPDGIGAEIVDIETLEHLHKSAREKSHREHIFNYIWENQDSFQIETFDPPDKRLMRPELRLDIDTREDYDSYRNVKFTPSTDIVEILNYKSQV